VTRDAIVAEARRLLDKWGGAVTADQAIILAATELTGDALDPFDFDDAAVLIRAERLFVDGLTISVALSTARRELVTFAEEGCP
jgi:hypothetical protein